MESGTTGGHLRAPHSHWRSSPLSPYCDDLRSPWAQRYKILRNAGALKGDSSGPSNMPNDPASSASLAAFDLRPPQQPSTLEAGKQRSHNEVDGDDGQPGPSKHQDAQPSPPATTTAVIPASNGSLPPMKDPLDDQPINTQPHSNQQDRVNLAQITSNLLRLVEERNSQVTVFTPYEFSSVLANMSTNPFVVNAMPKVIVIRERVQQDPEATKILIPFLWCTGTIHLAYISLGPPTSMVRIFHFPTKETNCPPMEPLDDKLVPGRLVMDFVRILFPGETGDTSHWLKRIEKVPQTTTSETASGVQEPIVSFVSSYVQSLLYGADHKNSLNANS